MILSILIVEDNSAIAQNIAVHLEPLGYTLDFATSGKQGLSLALAEYYDLLILDLNLPEMNGLDVCKAIRQRSERHIPVLMLTARDTLADKIVGFEHGADDYLTKPFALQELTMRCQALSRRNLLNTQHIITLGELQLDRAKKSVSRQNQTITLQHIPYTILQHLAESYPRVVSKSELCQKIWGDEPTESDALRSHLYQLRQALDKPFATALVKTIHGVGFTLDITL